MAISDRIAVMKGGVIQHVGTPRDIYQRPKNVFVATFIGRTNIVNAHVKDGIITDVKFNTFGCGSAIATSSMATELIKGKKVEDALELSNKAVVEALDGLPAHKIHCSVLAEEAVAAAVKDYYDRNGIAYDPELFSKKLHDCESCAE